MLNNLSPEEAQLVKYLFIEGKSYREISQLMNLTIEQLVDYEQIIYRSMRHPKNSKHLTPFLKPLEEN